MMIKANLSTSYKDNQKYITRNRDHRSNAERPALDATKGCTPVGRLDGITPARCDLRWSKEEDDQLLEMVDAGIPINVMCARLSRTADAVRYRALVLRHSKPYPW
jgi:hypothetical protein